MIESVSHDGSDMGFFMTRKSETASTSTFDADAYLRKMKRDRRISRMKSFIQHGRVSTYDHVFSVARLSLKINRKFRIHADEHELLKGALLHDYYLYDWHKDHGGHFHGFTHPETAMHQADRDFHLTDKERNMIRSHMWPLTLLHYPKNREAWILCIADKLVSTQETVYQR